MCHKCPSKEAVAHEFFFYVGVAAYNEKPPGNTLRPAETGYGNMMLSAKNITNRVEGYMGAFDERLDLVDARMEYYAQNVGNLTGITLEYQRFQDSIVNLTLQQGFCDLESYTQNITAECVPVCAMGVNSPVENLHSLGSMFLCWAAQDGID